MNNIWIVVYDEAKKKYIALEWEGGLTPKTIDGREVVITGYWKKPQDAAEYAEALLSRR
jgi:hypothetical protein